MHNVYREIYYLSALVGFGEQSYIENLTPAERRLYLNYYVEDQREKERQSRGTVFDATSPAVPPGINMAGPMIQQNGPATK